MVTTNPYPNESGHLLSAEVAAAYLGTTVRHIRRLVPDRRVAYVKVGRFIRFDLPALDAFIEAGRVDASKGQS